MRNPTSTSNEGRCDTVGWDRATETETWVTDPDGAAWEWYVRTGDAEDMTDTLLSDASAACCAQAVTEPVRFGRTGSSVCCRATTGRDGARGRSSSAWR